MAAFWIRVLFGVDTNVFLYVGKPYDANLSNPGSNQCMAESVHVIFTV